MKDTIFLSHANPEDNEFTRWLALQLTSEGYQVWCDLTNLLGGEDIWKNAEAVIREKTVKFLYVLSKTSNMKTGPLQELQIAVSVNKKESISDFIIPLLVDDLAHTEMNIQLNRLNAIGFNKRNWASGLKTLLELLEKENTPKNQSFNPSKVSDWWKSNFDSEVWLKQEAQVYFSNWFLIKDVPEKIFFHTIKNPSLGPAPADVEFPYPVYRQDHFLFSFADKKVLQPHIPQPCFINESLEFELQEFLAGKVHQIVKNQARNVFINLLNVGWIRLLQKRNLPTYELSNKKLSAYYTKNMISNGKVKYVNASGKNTSRKLIGGIGVNKIVEAGKEKTIKYWHFGIGIKPILFPENMYCVFPHVLFSDDGLNIWLDKKKLHKARRRFCSRWWNAEWRERILAFMSSLSDGNGAIEIDMSPKDVLKVSVEPIKFDGPVTYKTPPKIKREKDQTEGSFDEGEVEDVADGAE